MTDNGITNKWEMAYAMAKSAAAVLIIVMLLYGIHLQATVVIDRCIPLPEGGGKEAPTAGAGAR